jgi:transposase
MIMAQLTFRRIATRYDRHAQNYLSALALATIMLSGFE